MNKESTVTYTISADGKPLTSRLQKMLIEEFENDDFYIDKSESVYNEEIGMYDHLRFKRKSLVKRKFSWKRFLLVIGVPIIFVLLFYLNGKMFSPDSIWSWDFYLF